MDSGDRARLFDDLSRLPQADFERLLIAVAMPRMNRAGTSAKVGEQVSALLEWADSYIGPGLSAIQDYLDKLKNGSFPPTFDFSGYLEFILRQDSRYQDVRDLYTETDVLILLEAETVERRASEDASRSPEITQQKVERFPVLEGLQKHALGEKRQHLLLAGRPGSGKSTTLKRLLLEAAEVALEQPEIIPVYVQLKGDRPVIELILAEFRRAKVRISAEQLEDWLLEDRLLLLLDGVNEIPSDQQRRKLQAFREDNPTTPMIFTTRDLAVGGDLGIQKRLEMRPLSEPQMREFVNKYLTQRGLPNQADTLLRQLKDRLREVAETPLLLKMLCDVFDSTTGQIPQSKGELFRLFDAKYDQFKGLVAVSDDFRRFKPELLQHLAFCMLQGDPTSPTEAWLTIDRSQAERLLETYLTGRVEAPGQRAKEWLEDLLEHHLLQVATDPREIEFHHQLFQEYYAAEALLLKLELSELLEDEAQFKRDYLNLLKWTEPIALMLALVDNKDHALRVVKLAMDIDLRLGAKLAGEVALLFQEATVGEVIKLSVTDRLKVELLGETRSELAIPELLSFLTHKNIDVVEIATSYIGETSNQVAIDTITRRLGKISEKLFSQKSLGDSDKSGISWSTCVQSLSHISPQLAIKFLRQKLKEHGTLLLMMTQAAPILMRLDAENMIRELLEEFRNAQHEENRKIAADWEEPEREIQVPDSTDLKEKVDADIINLLKNTKITLPSTEFRQRNHILNLLGVSSRYELFIPELIQLFAQEPYETLQKQIIQILGASKFDTAIHFLVQRLGEDSRNLRAEAAKQLIKLKSIDNPKDLGELRNLAEHNNWHISWCAAIVLGHLKDSKVLPRMMNELENHQESSIRSTAAVVLGIVGDSNCIPSLLNVIDKDSDRYVRINAACSLSKFDQKEAIPTLLDSLKAPTNFDPHVEIMKSLSRLSLKEPLLEITQSKCLYWQRAAIELGRLAKHQGSVGSEVLANLFEALVDPGHESSSETIDFLSELMNLEMLNRLIDALINPENYTKDIYFQNRAALVLAKCSLQDINNKLPELIDANRKFYISQLSWLIPTIQNRCKFYNYCIWQEAMTAQNTTKETPETTTAPISYIFPNAPEVKIFERVEHYYEHPPDSDQ
ncbi:MAG: HEAT repeat domain-containing protein [Spirulina sp.]